MGKTIKGLYDKATKVSTVFIFDKNKKYVGHAKPTKEDEDFSSELVGLTIARAKAEINRCEKKNKEDEKKIDALVNEVVTLLNNIELREKRKLLWETSLKEYIEKKEAFKQKLIKVRTPRSKRIDEIIKREEEKYEV